MFTPYLCHRKYIIQEKRVDIRIFRNKRVVTIDVYILNAYFLD